MPDIALRFNKDMLVLSAPVENVLERQGVDIQRDMEYMILNEPEAIHDALSLENIAGAQCLVAPTYMLTQARLVHHHMENDAALIAKAAADVARELKPQHLLMELGPCGLPLDPSLEGSLKEHRGQYARAIAQMGKDFDALFLNGFDRLEDLECALAAAGEVAPDLPVFASVMLDGEGNLSARGTSVVEAAKRAAELGANVFGFETRAGADEVANLVKSVRAAIEVPILVQLFVGRIEPRAYEAAPDNPYCRPDFMVTAAAKAYAAGAQFLRATGAATPSYTGALMATVTGLDVRL